MSKLTVVTNNNDWEAIYIDGEKVNDQHLNRMWPKNVLKIVEKYDVQETEVRSIPVGEQFPSDIEKLDNGEK